MELPTERRGDTLVVHVDGPVTVGNRHQLRQKVLDELGRGEEKFLLDLSRTDFIDSAGLGVLVSLLKKIREQGGALLLARLNTELRDLFAVTKLDTIFRIEDDSGGGSAARPAPPRRSWPRARPGP
jgi:anti-sigma B factor antagonist